MNTRILAVPASRIEAPEAVFPSYADWWRAFSTCWNREPEAALLRTELSSPPIGDARVIDLGCGDMNLFRLGGLAAPTSYVGVDNCRELLNSGRLSFQSYSYHQRRIDHGALTLPAADYCLCLWVLHVCERPEDALSNVLQSVSGGCRAVVAVPDIHNPLYDLIDSSIRHAFPDRPTTWPGKLMNVHSLLEELSRTHDVRVHRFTNTVNLPASSWRRFVALSDFIRWELGLSKGAPLDSGIRAQLQAMIDFLGDAAKCLHEPGRLYIIGA